MLYIGNYSLKHDKCLTICVADFCLKIKWYLFEVLHDIKFRKCNTCLHVKYSYGYDKNLSNLPSSALGKHAI